MKYLTIVLKVADNADGQLVLKAAENISGTTLSAIAWAHALDERDDLMAEMQKAHERSIRLADENERLQALADSGVSLAHAVMADQTGRG